MKKKKQLILLIVCAALAIFAAACAIIMLWLGNILQSQRADERWRGENEERFAQVSCFFPVGAELKKEDILSFRQKIDPKLIDGGLEIPETGSLWTDAYSAKGSVAISSERGSATAAALGVGGDFFVFHPLRLRSGSYITGEDLMGDRVVLDEELAWRLFGGYELEGLYITIGDKPYYIAGVIAREEDFASQKAYTDGPGLFMSYDAMMELEASNGISCYELVCANPISGYVKSIVAEGLSQSGKYPVIENSSRFSLGALFGIIADFGTRSMNNYGVIYPYWENAARLIEDYMALLLLLALIFAVLPALCLFVVLVILARKGKTAAKHGAVALKDQIEEKSYERAAKKHADKEKHRGAKKRAKELEKSGKRKKKKRRTEKMSGADNTKRPENPDGAESPESFDAPQIPHGSEGGAVPEEIAPGVFFVEDVLIYGDETPKDGVE